MQNKKAISRQYERLNRYCGLFFPDLVSKVKNTTTNYFSQRDNYRYPHRSCNSSANATYLDWLLQVSRNRGLISDDWYLKLVLQFGDTIYHNNQTKAIKHCGFNTKWQTDADYPFIEDLLTVGFPVPVNILHRGSEKYPKGGHVICLIGMKNDYFIAHDPYGTLSSNYRDINGAYSKIAKSTFKNRWQGGYRILA